MPYVHVGDAYSQSLLDRFGVEFRRCRTLTGLTQAEVAENAGISQSSVSRLERGRAPGVSILTLARLSDVMDGRFPLASCPHRHACEFGRLDVDIPGLSHRWSEELDLDEKVRRAALSTIHIER